MNELAELPKPEELAEDLAATVEADEEPELFQAPSELQPESEEGDD